MMPQLRRSSLRSRIAPLSFGVGLALAAQIAGAAPSEPAPRKERIEQLWLDAAGSSGFVETTPLFLDGTPGTAHFGPSSCGRSHRLGAATLQLLQQATTAGQPVRVDVEAVAEGGRRCITGVAVFAPLP
ncbi:MAG: hypothetical protein H6712_35505 [Myxococcales bacterium]|nr:hypothetical protein [Myxococcales bacterium]MCB9719203.1 hypothetical protein [Myxococcales bacterium]